MHLHPSNSAASGVFSALFNVKEYLLSFFFFGENFALCVIFS